MRESRRAVVAAVGVFALAGCGGAHVEKPETEQSTTTRQATSTTTEQTTGEPTTTQTVPVPTTREETTGGATTTRASTTSTLSGTLTATPEPAPTVPGVSGKQMAAAVSTLVSAGYYADTGPVTAKSARGTVVGQEPRAGTKLAHGKSVRLAVSIGTKDSPLLPNVKIPNVVGKSAAAAREELVKARLTMATKFRRGEPSQVGKVIAQNPVSGVFRQYATVTILVGK
jgi:PASTA domain